MEPTVRRYIILILLLHVAFLAAVIAVIAAAGSALFATARADTEADALERVAIPTNQTKLLLERHFQGIFETLRLADRQIEPGGSPPSSLLAEPVTGRELWSQLNGRTSALLEVAARDLRLVEFRANPEPGAGGGASDQDAPVFDADERMPSGVPQPLRSSLRTAEQAHQLIGEARDWLAATASAGQPAVSGVFLVRGLSESGAAYSTPVVLAALPLPAGTATTQFVGTTAPGTRPAVHVILVGVVPVGYLEENFLFPASLPERYGMLLFDSSGRLVAGGGEALAGMPLDELVPKHLPASLDDFVRATIGGGSSNLPRQFDGRVDFGTIAFNTSLATARAVDATGRPIVGEGQIPLSARPAEQETDESSEARPLLTPSGVDADASTPGQAGSGRAPMWLIALVNREAVIAPLQQTARTAVLWAIAMVVAVTAILVSSAIQLIRARSRFERLRTELIDREMREARHIQLMWLPDDEIRQTPTRQIAIAAHNVPASHISGDFYNYFDLPDGRTAVVIGDVTGHGMTAAFLMATTQLLVRTTLQRLGDPGKTLDEVNDQLCSQAFHGQFVTIQLLVINTRTRELLAASAGHPPPLTRSAGGRWEALDIEPQLVLGVLEGSKYPTLSIPLEGRETLIMYTDGIIEVKSPSGARFSLEQLLEQMSRRIGSRVASAKDLVDETFSLIREFTGDTPQDDDLTLMAIHLSPHPTDASPKAASDLIIGRLEGSITGTPPVDRSS